MQVTNDLTTNKDEFDSRVKSRCINKYINIHIIKNKV